MSPALSVRTARSLRVALALVALALVALPGVASAVDPVHVNQTGYTPGEPKWVAVGVPAASFEVRRAGDDAVVLAGPLGLRRAADPASGDDVYEGDFTALATPGLYYVHVPGAGDSPPFAVDPAVRHDLYGTAMKGLFYQRCAFAIDAAHGGAYTHDACHDEGGGIASWDWATTGGSPGGYRNTIGGWHDAGDYGKYATNNAYAVGILLQGYETRPERFARDDVGIPESGNGVPDLLDEARWSLEWMLRMQEPDGSVLHRESIADFAGEFLPEDDAVTRYYTSISSDATAAHAAALALAARVYGPFDPAFAAACSTSAVSAWSWLQANPGRVPTGGFVNQHGHTGATYVGSSDLGHRVWAAAEVFRLTGDPAARDLFDANWSDASTFNGVWYPDSWGGLANLGAFSYRDAPGATADRVAGQWWSIENSVLSSAATWSGRVAGDGYGCVAATGGAFGDYYWGFTGVILRYAWILLQAHRYGGDPAHEEAAREQLHYVLGRNPMGKVYLTGVGARPVLHSHGAWNLAAGFVAVEDSLCHPIPGQLVGGPNAANNGHLSPYPGRCYEDIADPAYYEKGNWTLNETAVNIQAALVVLAGWFADDEIVVAVGDPVPGPAPRRFAPAPNPTRGATTLRWEAPGRAPTGLAVYDLAGRRVRSWPIAPGTFRGSIAWRGDDDAGRTAPAGVYFVRLEGTDAAAQRLVRLP